MVAPAKNPLAEAAERALASSFLDLLPPRVGGPYDRMIDHRGQPFGPPLCKLTPWRHHLLLGYESPFVTKAKSPQAVSPAEILQALYLCGAYYRGGSRLGFKLFSLRYGWLVRRRKSECVAAIALWLDSAFSAMPAMPEGGKDGAGRPVADVHWLAGWVRTGRKFFGLGESATLHTPYIRLWQYLELEMASDPARPVFDRKKVKQARAYLNRQKQPTKPSP